MSEERKAAVYDSELEAIKASRDLGMSLYEATSSDETVWVVATSEHQAKLALLDRVWPMSKKTKRDRDSRYLVLLENAFKAEKESTENDEQREADQG